MNKLLNKTADFMGTDTSVVICFLLPLVSLPASIASRNIITIVAWISQAFLQLFFLPVLTRASNRQSDAMEKSLLQIESILDKIERFEIPI